MADTQTAPANTGAAGTTIADALDAVEANPAMLSEFLDMDLGDDEQDNGDDTAVAEEDQGESQSDGDEDETDLEENTAEEDDQGSDQSDEESEADAPLKLFTLGDDGAQQEVDLDDLEVPIEIDGEDQLLAFDELKKGYLRQADYTRKTQEVSERVAQEVEGERDKLSADFSERMQQIDEIVAVFGQSFDREPSLEQLKAQYGGDEAKAWQAMHQWKALSEKLQGAKNLAVKQQSEDHARAQKEMVATVNRTIQTLRDTVPEWKDKAKFDAESTAMRAFMLKNGLDDDDILGVLQKPATVLMVRDAMYGQSLRKKKGSVTKRLRKAPKTVNKTGGHLQKPTGDQKRHAQLRKRVRGGKATKADAIAMIESTLDD